MGGVFRMVVPERVVVYHMKVTVIGHPVSSDGSPFQNMIFMDQDYVLMM